MSRDEILKKLEFIFQDVLNENDIILSESSTPNDIDNWDSLTNIQIMVEIEKLFNIRFVANEINEWRSVGNIVSSISRAITN